MSYDLNILCVDQKVATNNLPNGINICAKSTNKKPDDNPKYYNQYCPFMNTVNGIWYYLKLYSSGTSSSYELCDINIETDVSVEEFYPFWHEDQIDIDVSIFMLREEYKQDVLNTIKHFINLSPVNTVMFHSRYQTLEDESEYIYGTFTYSQFINLLDTNRILFNTCYIIRDNKI